MTREKIEVIYDANKYWTLMENDVVHTRHLSEEDAEEMSERLSRFSRKANFGISMMNRVNK